MSEKSRLPWGLAVQLALGQVVSWGVLYYAFAVVLEPMRAATGWSRSFLNAGWSFGLFTWGVCAFPVGLWIQRHGARTPMLCGTVLGGIALACLGLTTSKWGFVCAWGALGASMAAALYESTFAVILEHFGVHYRRGITLVTLIAGFASTAFLPLTQHLTLTLGWQNALLALAGLQVALCVPWYWAVVPRRVLVQAPAASQQPATSRPSVNLARELRDPRFLGVALFFATHTAAFAGFMFQLLPVLSAAHVSTTTALHTAMLVGPMQVLGRMVLGASGDDWSSLRVALFATAGLTLSLVLLTQELSVPVLVGFAVLFGASNGIMTIVRGTILAELFDAQRYASLNGALAVPTLLGKALSPLLLAATWSLLGSFRAMLWTACALAVLGLLGLGLAARPGAASLT